MTKIYKNWGPPLVIKLMATSKKLMALRTGEIKTRSLAILLLFSLILMNSCKTDEVAAPAAATLTADKATTVLATPVNFTISQVSASAVTLYPYGLANANMGTVAVTFTNGAAIVPFSYTQIGTWKAVVVTNNNSTDPRGKVSVKNSYSAEVAITVSNDLATFSKFNISKSTSRKVALDAVNKVVNDTIPWDPSSTGWKLTSNFTADAFSTVTVGTTAQVSGTTVNDFSSGTVTYTVKSADGAHTNNYPVHIYMTPAATDNKIKSVSGVATSKKANSLSVVGVVDNANKQVVLYQPYGTPTDYNDSIKFHYTLNNGFALMKYGGKALKQDSTLDLTSSKTVVVFAQDSTTASYTVIAGVAPKLTLTLDPSVPVTDVASTGFNIGFTVAAGTVVTALNTKSTITLPPSGVTINSISVSIGGAAAVPFTTGDPIDYTKPAKFTLSVHDTNIGVDYNVAYTVSVTVLK